MLRGFPAWICTHQPCCDLFKEKPRSLTFVLGATLESYLCLWPRPCLGLKAMGAYWELEPVKSPASCRSAHRGQKQQQHNTLPCLWGHVLKSGGIFVVTAARSRV